MGGRYVLGFSVSFLWPLWCSRKSQSATETIIEKIYQSELRVREHVDKKIEGLETKISAVDTKVETLSTTVGNLSKEVTENKTNIENLKGTSGFDFVRHSSNFNFYSRLFF